MICFLFANSDLIIAIFRLTLIGVQKLGGIEVGGMVAPFLQLPGYCILDQLY